MYFLNEQPDPARRNKTRTSSPHGTETMNEIQKKNRNISEIQKSQLGSNKYHIRTWIGTIMSQDTYYAGRAWHGDSESSLKERKETKLLIGFFLEWCDDVDDDDGNDGGGCCTFVPTLRGDGYVPYAPLAWHGTTLGSTRRSGR